MILICRAKWIREGDRNSALFQAYASLRKVNKPLPSLKIDGRLTSDLSEIG